MLLPPVIIKSTHVHMVILQNADTGTTCVTFTDTTVLVPVLDPRNQCTLVPIPVPVFEQYGTFVLYYFLLTPVINFAAVLQIFLHITIRANAYYSLLS